MKSYESPICFVYVRRMVTLYYMTIKQTSRWAFHASWNAMQTYSVLPIIAIPPCTVYYQRLYSFRLYFYYLRSSRIVKASDKPTGINPSATRRVIKLTHNNLSQRSCFNWWLKKIFCYRIVNYMKRNYPFQTETHGWKTALFYFSVYYCNNTMYII